MVDDLVSRTVEAGRQRPLGDRHPDRVGRALAQRACRGLDPRRQEPFGMARCAASPLPESLQVLHRQVIAGQIEKAIEQHAAVPRREHEPVAVGPLRILRVVLQVPLPEDVGHGSGAERQTGMARFRLLNGVDRERANRVDAQLVHGLPDGAQMCPLTSLLL